jgi:hypothetical protein
VQYRFLCLCASRSSGDNSLTNSTGHRLSVAVRPLSEGAKVRPMSPSGQSLWPTCEATPVPTRTWHHPCSMRSAKVNLVDATGCVDLCLGLREGNLENADLGGFLRDVVRIGACTAPTMLTLTTISPIDYES